MKKAFGVRAQRVQIRNHFQGNLLQRCLLYVFCKGNSVREVWSSEKGRTQEVDLKLL